MTPLDSTSPRPPQFIQEIFRASFYQITLGNDHILSQMIIKIHNFFVRMLHMTGLCGRPFTELDPIEAEKTVKAWQSMGAKIQFVTPKDQKGSIQMMTFRAKDLEHHIHEKGGTWEKRTINDKNVYAIIPPVNSSKEWKELEDKFSFFDWKKENGIFITSENAHLVENKPTQCFLHCPAAILSFAQEQKRAGFYLGNKQDICFFDKGNTWKNKGRSPSERSFYLEIEKVHDTLKEEYATDYDATKLWVGGFCFGVIIASYLKRTLHTQGINFYAEHNPLGLDDFSSRFHYIRGLFPYFKGSLHKKDDYTKEDRPPQTDFNVHKLLENLPFYNGKEGGKFVIIQQLNDDKIPKGVSERVVELAKKINEKVDHIVCESKRKKGTHTDFFYKHNHLNEAFWKSVFN